MGWCRCCVHMVSTRDASHSRSPDDSVSQSCSSVCGVFVSFCVCATTGLFLCGSERSVPGPSASRERYRFYFPVDTSPPANSAKSSFSINFSSLFCAPDLFSGSCVELVSGFSCVVPANGSVSTLSCSALCTAYMGVVSVTAAYESIMTFNQKFYTHPHV